MTAGLLLAAIGSFVAGGPPLGRIIWRPIVVSSISSRRLIDVGTTAYPLDGSARADLPAGALSIGPPLDSGAPPARGPFSVVDLPQHDAFDREMALFATRIGNDDLSRCHHSPAAGLPQSDTLVRCPCLSVATRIGKRMTYGSNISFSTRMNLRIMFSLLKVGGYLNRKIGGLF
jgi:hypothetical protein